MALLEVVDVTKVFPGVRALDEVSFTLQPGEVHALVGENGAGKSTLIKVLTGVYQPDGGELRYRTRPAAFATPMDAQRAGISTIYQEVNLIPLMSVAHNLFLGREPRNRFGLLDERPDEPRGERDPRPATGSPPTCAASSARWRSARSRWSRWPGP